MYTQNAFLLTSYVEKDGSVGEGWSVFETLVSRKTRSHLLFRDDRGEDVAHMPIPTGRGPYLLVHQRQELFGESSTRLFRVNDRFAKRIITYITDYYGTEFTNCSTLAEYLRTGIFLGKNGTDCGIGFTAGMSLYAGQKIRPGDTLAILYYNKNGRSRRVSRVRAHYRRNSKNQKGNLASLKASRRRSVSS